MCVRQGGGQQQQAGGAPMGHQQLWQSQDASLGGPMVGPMAGAAHDAKASIEGVDLLPSKGRDGPWAGGAGRGQGSGVEWSGVGERERRAREARPPGKATHELVQLRHSSVLLLQFARFPSQMLPSHYSLVPSLPDCQSVESSHQCRLQPPPPAPSSELPLRGLHCYVPRKMAVAP